MGVANNVARADGRAAAVARRARAVADAAESGVPMRGSAPGWGTTRKGRTGGLRSGGSTHGRLRPRGPRTWSDGGVFRRVSAGTGGVVAGRCWDASGCK